MSETSVYNCSFFFKVILFLYVFSKARPKKTRGTVTPRKPTDSLTSVTAAGRPPLGSCHVDTCVVRIARHK